MDGPRSRGVEMITKRKKVAVAGIVTLAGIAWAGAAIATGNADDDEAPITGPELEQASAAALEYTGEGRVTETEVGDEDSYYEVEVTLDDGSQVDVQLDRDFNLVGGEADGTDDHEGDDEGDDS
jgi:uncharacterized membrane protein YkoI